MSTRKAETVGPLSDGNLVPDPEGIEMALTREYEIAEGSVKVIDYQEFKRLTGRPAAELCRSVSKI